MIFKQKFHKKETQLYLIIWISAILYAIYKYTKFSQKYFLYFDDHYEDFANGWSILGSHKRDKADFEWETIKYFLKNVFPIILCYLIASETLKQVPTIDIKVLQCFQVLFPLLYIIYSLQYWIVMIVLMQPFLFYLAALKQRTPIIWTVNLVCLILISVFKNTCATYNVGHNQFEVYLLIMLLCWQNLKCTSFCLDGNKATFLEYLAYCFYFPTLFTGPFICYNDTNKGHQTFKGFSFLMKRLKVLLLNIGRCLFWVVFVDFCLHFIYVNAASFELKLINELDFCSLCGYGYLMGQFFHIKYVVLYGLSTSLASFENVTVPSLPRCIGRVHLYSEMWKYFDPGLHKFLKTYIFVPSANKLGLNKLQSSFLCFSFVYVWHGIEGYIFIWAALNFLGIALEHLAYTIYANKLKTGNFIKKLDLRRLKCILASPLLAMSAISNFYFFAGKQVGDIFVEKSIHEYFPNQLLVLFILYCCCQVSEELKDVNSHNTSIK